jgi:hypothetical protein
MQPLEPIRAVPASFNPDEAQQLLDKRWAEVLAQGLHPVCQCSNTSSQGEEAAAPAAAAAADGGSGGEDGAAGGNGSSKPSSNFLEQLAAAVKVNSADGAWDD